MNTYRSRGYANTYMGHYDAAAADFARVLAKIRPMPIRCFGITSHLRARATGRL